MTYCGDVNHMKMDCSVGTNVGGRSVTDELHREHWIVPVHGLVPSDPDGTVQAVARRDGTVILQLTFGRFQTAGRLDVCRAAQLSTGIWEAAGIAQALITCVTEGRCLPRASSNLEDLPPDWRKHSERDEASGSTTRAQPRRLTPADNTAAIEVTRTIGLQIRRTRDEQDKSLRVISGLSGISSSILHRIEHGRREVTISEIVALAQALQVRPSQLIALPDLTPSSRSL